MRTKAVLTHWKHILIWLIIQKHQFVELLYACTKKHIKPIKVSLSKYFFCSPFCDRLIKMQKVLKLHNFLCLGISNAVVDKTQTQARAYWNPLNELGNMQQSSTSKLISKKHIEQEWLDWSIKRVRTILFIHIPNTKH